MAHAVNVEGEERRRGIVEGWFALPRVSTVHRGGLQLRSAANEATILAQRLLQVILQRLERGKAQAFMPPSFDVCCGFDLAVGMNSFADEQAAGSGPQPREHPIVALGRASFG